MKTSKKHTNKPLISITNGQKLGEIKDLYLDNDMHDVVAVSLGKEGLLSHHKVAMVLLRSDVQVCGIDVWLVSDSDKVHKQDEVSEVANYVLVSELHGREIQTEGGTKLGVIEDVLLDDETHVVGFTLAKVYARGLLAERKTIAREAVMNLGSKEEPMTIDLSKAEALALPSE